MTVGRGKFREDCGHGLAVLSKEKGVGESAIQRKLGHQKCDLEGAVGPWVRHITGSTLSCMTSFAMLGSP